MIAGMAYPQYIAAADTRGASGGPPQMDNSGMLLVGNQGSVQGPVYVTHVPPAVQYPPTAGFMHHRSNLMMAPRLQSDRPHTHHGAQISGMNSDAQPRQTSTFTPPHPIMTGPSSAFNVNVPTGIVIQSSPIQMSPHNTMQSFSTVRPSTAPISDRNGYVTAPLTTDHVPQQSTKYIYSPSHDSETPLSSAFPQQASAPGTHLSQEYAHLSVPQQMAHVGQIQVQAQSAGNKVQTNQDNMQYQVSYQYPNVQVAHAFEPGQASAPVIYQYQTPSQGLPGDVALSNPTSASQYGGEAGPFSVGPSAPPLIAQATNQPVQLMQYSEELGWIHYGQSGTGQYTGIPAGFTASHSHNPRFKRGGHVIPDDEEEECVGTFTYDPYMVKHRKRTTPEQLAILENAFEEGPKPTASMRKMIAEKIGMTPRSVQVWFQNRRQKKKMLAKKNLEGESSEALTQSSSPHPANPYAMGSSTAQSDASAHAGPSRSGQHDRPSLRRGPVHQIAYEGPGVMKLTPMGQARRGSLPYPPPQSPVATMPPVLARTVSSSGLARAQIPAHLAMSSNGRRASLPVNSQSISLGFFTPPRIGPKAMGTLGAIADDEHLLYQEPTQPPSAPVAGVAPANQLGQWGPLPNPEFSFGNAASVARKASLSSAASMSPNVVSPVFPGGSVYRNRMGSMASILSQATTADGTSDSDWERTQQLITPFMMSNAESMNMFGGPDMGSSLVEDGPEMNKQLRVPLYNDTRRASAPAELLQKFAILDVEQQRHLQAGQKSRSPLNVSFTGGNQEGDSPSEASATASPPARPSVFAQLGSIEQMRSSVL